MERKSILDDWTITDVLEWYFIDENNKKQNIWAFCPFFTDEEEEKR